MTNKVTGKAKLYFKRIVDKIYFLENIIEGNVVSKKPISYQKEEIEALLWLSAHYQISSETDLRPTFESLSQESKDQYEEMLERLHRKAAREEIATPPT